MKKILFIGMACLMMVLPGCAKETVALDSLFPRDNIHGVQITFRMDTWDLEYQMDAANSIFADFISAVYSAPPVQERLAAYSPELSATHVITLMAQSSTVTVYFDQSNNLISIPAKRTDGSGEAVRTYHQFTANLGGMLAMLETTALEEEKNRQTPAPVVDEGLLHIQIDESELENVGEEILSEHFTYERAQQDPFYGALTYTDQVEGVENGYVLLVAAWGECPSTGYEIDIAAVEENSSYYMVRITSDAPAQDAQVDKTTSYPTAAVLVDARRMMEDKPVVFISENRTVLYTCRLDRDFLDNIPDDMPALTQAEDIDGEE